VFQLKGSFKKYFSKMKYMLVQVRRQQTPLMSQIQRVATISTNGDKQKKKN